MVRGRVGCPVLLIHLHVAALARFGFIDPNKNVGLALFRFGQLFCLLHIVAFAHPPKAGSATGKFRAYSNHIGVGGGAVEALFFQIGP